jgi:3-oxoacyl-[acyl-carrier protein] reductase
VTADGRSALITGASRGIGLGISRTLAAQGWRLTLAARDAARLNAVATELDSTGQRVRALPTDMASEDAVARLAHAHRDVHGTMDALILCAGVGSAAPMADASLARFDKQMTVNVRSAVQLVQSSLPMLREASMERPSTGARVIALSSITGIYAEEELGLYGATKAALSSICRSINAEHARHGVGATAISPGYVDTDMSQWVHSVNPPESMITVADIVVLVDALLRLSAQAVVPEIAVTRAQAGQYRA